MRARRWIARGAALAISVVFLYLVVRKVDYAQLMDVLGRVSYWWFIPVAALYLCGFIPRALKWKLILDCIQPIPLPSVLGYTFVGCMGNAVLPARLGELVRAYILSRREGTSASGVVSTIVLERVLEILSLLILFSLAVWFTGLGHLQAMALGGLGLCLAGLAVLFVLQRRGDWLLRLVGRLPWPGIRERAGHLVADFLKGLAVVRSFGPLLAILGLGLLVYFIEGASYWLLARAFGMEISYLQSLFVLCFIFIGMLIPASAGNVGPLQYFGALGLSFFGVGAAAALPYTVFINALMYLPALIGLFYLHRYGVSLAGMRKEIQPAGKP